MSLKINNSEIYIKELLYFIGFCLVFTLLGSGFILLFKDTFGESPTALFDILNEKTEPDIRNTARLYLMISHLFTFALPCLAYAIWRYKSKTLSSLKLNRFPHPNNVLYSIMIVLVSFPFIMLVMWLNQQLPMSDAMLELEAKAAKMTENLLLMTGQGELIVTLIAVAVTPAIGEELMFRGILQPIFTKLFRNEHLAVWITAILFSAIHFQMQGFIPRMLLGAFFGYFYLYTQNLWVPILTHFVFNGSQVVAKYTTDIAIESPEMELSEIIIPSLISLVITTFLGYLFWKFNQDRNQLQISENQIINE